MKTVFFAILFTAIGFNTFAKEAPQIVNLHITEKGFEPNSVDAKPNVPVVLNVTRKTDSTCATQIQIPSKKIKKELPLNKTVSINVGKLEKGEIRFGCGMNMMEGGKIFVR